MAKNRLKPKKYARKKATELSELYNIEYSKDGETFKIYKKGDKARTPVRKSELLGVDDGKLFNRRKKLVTRKYEELANNDPASQDVIITNTNDGKNGKDGEKGKDGKDEEGIESDPNLTIKSTDEKEKYDLLLKKNKEYFDRKLALIRNEVNGMYENYKLEYNKLNPIPGLNPKKATTPISDDVYTIDKPGANTRRWWVSELDMFAPKVKSRGELLKNFIEAKSYGKKLLIYSNNIYDIENGLTDLRSNKYPKKSENYKLVDGKIVKINSSPLKWNVGI